MAELQDVTLEDTGSSLSGQANFIALGIVVV